MIPAHRLAARQTSFCPERDTFQYWLRSRSSGRQCVGIPDPSLRFSANGRDPIQAAQKILGTIGF